MKLGQLVFAVVCVAVMGCQVRLSALTTPPPTRVADLNDGAETFVLSRGAALAFECDYSDFWSGGPCTGATVAIDDERIAKVYPAHVDHLVPGGFDTMSTTQQVGFVVVGVSTGTTTLRIRVDGMDDEYEVVVQ
jgi:hypothetical protein